MLRIGRAATFLLTAIIGLASASDAMSQTPKHGGIFRHAIEGEPPSYDCHAVATSFALQALAPHYSTLLKYDQDDFSKIVGDLAESWTVSLDRLTYTFKLRPGVKFHNGSELTSADIKATFDRLRNPPKGVTSARRGQFGSIESIETPAADTVVFKLNRVNPAALFMFASPWNCVYSAKKLEADPNWYATNVMGTGPFVFEEHVKGSHWSAKRFDQYFVPGKPYLDGIRAYFMSGSATVNGLAGGQIDGILYMVVAPEQARLRKLKKDEVKLDTNVFNVTLFLTVNTKMPPFNDPRVRRALSLALDRQGGLEGLKRLAAVDFLTVLVPPGGISDFSKEEMEKIPGFGKDIEARRAEARKLLAEAGVPNLKLTLLNRNVRTPWQPVGVFVMDQWRQIGIQVDQIPAETPQYFAAITSGNYDVALDFNNTVSVDPNETLVKFVSGNPNNYSGSDDKLLVELYDKQAVATDPDERKKLVRQFLDRMMDQLYSIPLIGSNRTTAVLKEVKGWRTPPTTVMNLDLSNVWFDR